MYLKTRESLGKHREFRVKYRDLDNRSVMRAQLPFLEFERSKARAAFESSFEGPEIPEAGHCCDLSYRTVFGTHEMFGLADSHPHQPIPETNARLLVEKS